MQVSKHRSRTGKDCLDQFPPPLQTMMKEKPGSKRNLMMSAFPLSSLALLLTFSKDVSSSSSSTERESLIPGLVSGQFSPRRRSATFRGTDCHNKGNKAKQIYHGQSQPDAARIQDSTWLANDQSVAAYNNLLHLLIFFCCPSFSEQNQTTHSV